MKKGLTLMEVLVYVGVLVVILVAVSSLFLWVVRLSNKAKLKKELFETSHQMMGKMIFEIREAKSVYLPTTTTTQLSLKTERQPPAGEATTFVDFFLCDSSFCLKKEGVPPVVLNPQSIRIQELEFSVLASTSTTPSVQIHLKTTYENPADLPEPRMSITLDSTASLRNY